MEQKYIESPDKKNDATGTSNRNSRKPPERTRTARTPANINGIYIVHVCRLSLSVT